MMRDLQRSNPLYFDGHGAGLKAKTLFLDMVCCFSLHPYARNVKAHCAITQLRDYGSIWWDMESAKLQISIADLTWEIFEERLKEKFLSDHNCEAHVDEFHELK